MYLVRDEGCQKWQFMHLKGGFFNSIFRIWTDEVSRQHLNMIQLSSKNLSLVKKLTPLYPPKKHSAQMQLCFQRKKNIHRGDQRKTFEKKNGKYFFIKHFLMKKIQGNIQFPYRKIKCKKLCANKISTRKIVENEPF